MGPEISRRPPLDSDLDVDVAICGGGYTGLWTAYYLAVRAPAMRIAILEREFAGFGASGRNGGWCSALMPLSWQRLAALVGAARATAMQRAVAESVDEVGRVAVQERWSIDFLRSGTLTLAMNPAQEQRLGQELAAARRRGVGEADLRWLSAGETAARLAVPRARGALFTPHCARLHPARLVRGLAATLVNRGVQLYEDTPAVRIVRGGLRTPRAHVRAPVVVRATEGYSPLLPGQRRQVLPLVSSMIATEPLDPATWSAIGWRGCETVNDGRHLLIYAQRTADGRIAFGGRGAPYHYGSRVELPQPQDDVFGDLARELGKLFPATRRAEITHRWSGPIGVSRDWRPTVGLDRSRGLAWAGGFVGDGVATANLAGRTLADVITGTQSELTELAWVNHRPPAWPPEPLRWMGVSTALAILRSADRIESHTGRGARRVTLLNRLIGR